jgi:chorismate synthase
MISNVLVETSLPANSFGKEFVVTLFGESHGRCVGTVLDGCPAGLALCEEDVQRELDRRVPKARGISSARVEPDRVQILSGVFRGRTTGAPIAMIVENRDADSSPYEQFREIPRPGHADYPAMVRYGGFNDYRGGGRFSGRITVGLIMAGAVAKKLLAQLGIEVLAYTLSIGNITSNLSLSREELRRSVYESSVRCGDREASLLMEKAVLEAAEAGDSLGGIVKAVAYGVPPGVGEPVFECLDSELAKALFNIPAVKGVEFGLGFDAARSKGSMNNDPLTIQAGKVQFITNRAGGILGGLSTGREIAVQVAFKPTPSIRKKQRSVNLARLEEAELELSGRHDPCVVPKAVPVVEAVVSTVLSDFLIRAGLLPKVLK